MPKLVDSDTVDRYMGHLRATFPKLKISRKKPWWLRFVFNLPGIKKLEWGNATQTVGMNIWLSDRWDEIHPTYQMSTLRHEKKHLIWFNDYGLILVSILYLFCFFPIGLAYFRARMERDGYAESLKARVEYFGTSDRVKEKGREMYERAFTGWMYLKMWPFKKTIRKWFEEDWAEAVRMHG